MNTIQYNKQRGVTLVVSLIILISLTMIGLTSMQRTTSELTMAGNQRETGLVFQSAESGLVAAEVYISNSNTNGDFTDDDKGLFTVDAENTAYVGPDYFDKSTWVVGSGAQNAVSPITGMPDSLYKVEYLGDRYQNIAAIINIGGYGTQQTGTIVSVYRSTARGAGLTGNAFRYIQTYFGKKAP